MKKVSLILFASMLFALGACSSDDNQDQSSNASDTNTNDIYSSGGGAISLLEDVQKVR